MSEDKAYNWRSEAGRKGALARKVHSNGSIKARQSARAELNAEEHRARIKVGQLQERLMSAAMGRVKMDSNQVQACKVLLDKAMPTLQAVETTSIEPAAVKSESELLAEIAELIKANPDLVQRALALNAQSNPSVQPVGNTPNVDITDVMSNGEKDNKQAQG